MLDQIVLAIKSMSFGTSNPNSSFDLTLPKFLRSGFQRSLNFIPSSPYYALRYCTRLLLYTLKVNDSYLC